MFWGKIDVLKKNKVCSGPPCKYSSYQSTHTTRMASDSQRLYQSSHSVLMPILSSSVWFPLSPSFSQLNDTLSSLPTILFPFSSPVPILQPLDRSLKTDLFFMTLIKLHSFVRSPRPIPTSSSALTLSLIHILIICMYYTMLYLLVHIPFSTRL